MMRAYPISDDNGVRRKDQARITVLFMVHKNIYTPWWEQILLSVEHDTLGSLTFQDHV